MRSIWSSQRKFTTWRRLWLALAEAQQELGLRVAGEPISDEQLEELRAHLHDIDHQAGDGRQVRLIKHTTSRIHRGVDQNGLGLA